MFKLVLIVLSFLVLTGCTIEIGSDNKTNNDNDVDSSIIEANDDETKVISKGVESSYSNPLTIGQTGLASKYNAVLMGYKDVDVNITKIYDNPNEIIDNYNLDNVDNMIESKVGYKYVVLDYEVTFFDFETESFGTDVTLDVEVLNVDNSNFVVDDVKQVITIYVLSKDTGVVDGGNGMVQIAFAIPNSVSNYLVKFGTSEHTIAYYKV